MSAHARKLCAVQALPDTTRDRDFGWIFSLPLKIRRASLAVYSIVDFFKLVPLSWHPSCIHELDAAGLGSMMTALRLSIAQLGLLMFCAATASAVPDIVFVTQPPHPADFATANATFGNQLAGMDSIPRGGDLYIRYSDGTLKNITRAAGYGVDGFQGTNAIAVRDPAVHWNGNKIIFSMVIGAPAQRYQYNSYRWQLYEVTGIGRNETPQISKVTNQPSTFNNVMPIYGTNDRIIFVSDRPAKDLTHTYPQRDEYESTATNTGLWSLDAASGDLIHLDHAPSGDFNPSLDSFGRVIFTRWDHLQRDQQNRCSNESYGAFNYSSEASNANALDSDLEVYPEARGNCEAGPDDANLNRHSFNHFLPWQMQEDGTQLETINHVGRHELVSYIERSVNNDASVEEFYGQYSRINQNSIENFFQLHEDPREAGSYFGINGPEFRTHASGQIIKMSAPPSKTADQISIVYVTHPDTSSIMESPSSDHIGFSRDPLPLSDGSLVAAHTFATAEDRNTGSSTQPQALYAYRLRVFFQGGTYWRPGTALTSGITKTLSFWSPDELVSYNNTALWELQPREIRVRNRPTRRTTPLPDPETRVFSELGVDLVEFTQFLRENDLALIVSRNVTTRDALDRQQPSNLKVAGSSTATSRDDGKVYEVAHLQLFQGDLIRGYGGIEDPEAGRRVIAQTLHSLSDNPANADGPSGSVQVASDGSVAAFVPARRALTYQLTDAQGKGVVRERLWLTFQPGEIRICASCHGVNSRDQSGSSEPLNEPEALRRLLEHWQDTPHEDPQMGLTVTAFGSGKKNSRAARSNGRLRIAVTGENSRAAAKSVILRLRAGKTDCGEAARFTTDSSGNYRMTTKKLPGPARKSALSFSLTYLGRSMATASLSLAHQSGSKLSGAKLCKALLRTIR